MKEIQDGLLRLNSKTTIIMTTTTIFAIFVIAALIWIATSALVDEPVRWDKDTDGSYIQIYRYGYRNDPSHSRMNDARIVLRMMCLVAILTAVTLFIRNHCTLSTVQIIFGFVLSFGVVVTFDPEEERGRNPRV